MARRSKEEQVAAKISKELADFTLDLEQVGYYLAQATPYVIFRRAIEVLESCEYQSEVVEYRRIGDKHGRLF